MKKSSWYFWQVRCILFGWHFLNFYQGKYMMGAGKVQARLWLSKLCSDKSFWFIFDLGGAEQPQNAKIGAKLNINTANFRLLFRAIFAWIFVFWAASMTIIGGQENVFPCLCPLCPLAATDLSYSLERNSKHAHQTENMMFKIFKSNVVKLYYTNLKKTLKWNWIVGSKGFHIVFVKYTKADQNKSKDFLTNTTTAVHCIKVQT